MSGTQVVPIKSPRSPNAFKMWWTLSQKLGDVLVLSELFHNMEQVLVQDGMLLQFDTSPLFDNSGLVRVDLTPVWGVY